MTLDAAPGDPVKGTAVVVEIAELVCPVGTIRLAARGRRLCALGFADRWARLERALRRRFPGVELRPGESLGELLEPLRAYFRGDLAAIEALAVDAGGTAFQQRVWSALRAVPGGRTVSYAELARSIGAPRAIRAVGRANGANPVSIVVPCHRVIGSDGRLTGYGGGLERKRWLLAHEGAIRAGAGSAAPPPRAGVDQPAERPPAPSPPGGRRP